ncbi:MAG: hypothetical protein J6K03_09620 [Oscillospiraceae bacterium]|nr:hypothetical protein [Oscillospiraceae bacterium]
MAIPLYLAMTAAEFRRNTALPKYPAWLSCLFSPYSTGLSNIPSQLPPESLLILSDRTPVCGHDPGLIKAQLEEAIARLRCSAVLLDLQRPEYNEAVKIVKEVCELLCPVAVSQMYAQDVDRPICLPPVPIDVCLEEYLAPWQGREIWLEMALDGQIIKLTEQGAEYCLLPVGGQTDEGRKDKTLHCHYTIHTEGDIAEFTLFRTREDTVDLLEEAEKLGVKLAVGLFQELG